MRVITIANHKGGVAKTTTSVNLAATLTQKGYKVLLVDFDPQCNATINIKANINGVATLYDILVSEENINHAIQECGVCDCIAGDPLLVDAEKRLTQVGREYIFREAMQKLEKRYDYVICDTPPNLGILLVNSLMASNGIILPVSADKYAIEGSSYLEDTINKVKKYGNPELEIYGILRTRFRPQLTTSKMMQDRIEETAKKFNTIIFSTYIKECIEIRKAQINDKSVIETKSQASVDYDNFTNELLEICDAKRRYPIQEEKIYLGEADKPEYNTK